MTRGRKILTLALAALSPALGAIAQADGPVRLAVPEGLSDSGFLQHLLPRFRFKSRIEVVPVPADAEAAMVLTPEGGGDAVFEGVAGATWTLQVRPGDARAATFADWLQSDAGVAAIEGFSPDGSPMFRAIAAQAEAEAGTAVGGDAATGARLALGHCGRCHVVDERNRMGGIGSAPSFRALRARDNWRDLFLAFWAENPHPSFTEVEGVTEAFDATEPAHVTPMEITFADIEAIAAFVGTLEPKDLGARIRSR